LDVSVVVPTYCRPASLIRTLVSLAASLRDGFDDFEILVVDDGSPVAAAEVVEAAVDLIPAPVKVVRQPNGGPAAARNHGFSQTSGKIVLFVDDDIEVPPTLLSAHLAAHRAFPGCVVFGPSLLPTDVGDALLSHLLDELEDAPATAEFEPSRLVASGHLSVERALFPGGTVYRGDLRTPAAEEYELSFRLQSRAITAIRANRIVASHRAELSLGAVCRGQYQHGRGCAEAAAKAPETLSLPELRHIVQRARLSNTNAMGQLKRAASSRLGRRILLDAGHIARDVPAVRRAAPLLYRWAIAAHFTAGVRVGLRDFGYVERAGRASASGRPGRGNPC
jgi:glycosyltransferase involved in cell wall biosynthesis